MRIPRHWVREAVEAKDSRGEVHRGEAWGWSESDVEEAKQRARTSAERVADWLVRGGRDPVPSRSAEYLYNLDRPPREEIVQELHDAAGETTALITRNIYGALVLNTRDLMFIDVDFPPSPAATAGLLTRLFGTSAPPSTYEDAVMSRVQGWCSRNSDRGVRLYRTAAGLRVVLTGQPMQPNGDDSRRILEELGSDPLYRRLCEAQECFRARLTPKPWRMHCDVPPSRFPFADTETEQEYREWQREYDETAPRFATCQLVNAYGAQEPHPELSPLLKLHDSLTGIVHTLPLA
jgi:hypothetical protein